MPDDLDISLQSPAPEEGDADTNANPAPDDGAAGESQDPWKRGLAFLKANPGSDPNFLDDSGAPGEADNQETGATTSDDGKATTQADDGAAGKAGVPGAEAIQPPASMTAEELAEFKTLTPKQQEFVARREREAQAGMTRSTQEAAKARDGWAAEMTQFRDFNLQIAERLKTAIKPPPVELAQTNPVEYNAQFAHYTARKQQADELAKAAEAEAKAADDKLKADQAERAQAYQADQWQKLTAKQKDWADPVKAKEAFGHIGKYLADSPEFQASQDDLAAVFGGDHRFVIMAHKSMLCDKMIAEQADKKALADKKSKNAPPVQKPGTVQDGDAKQKEIAGLRKQLAKTHNSQERIRITAKIATLSGAL